MRIRVGKRPWLALVAAVGLSATTKAAELKTGEVHVWDVQEIILRAARDYPNPYADVVCWIVLEGPDPVATRRVYGFWDGGRTFRVRLVAPAPGEWRWTTASNQPDDPGLNGGRGRLVAVDWTEAEKQENPNRRGFVRATANGHALQYADGTPFFLLGDTWLAASTWRLPFRGAAAPVDYRPGPGIGFEEAVAYRKRQGFNSISFIAAFPNWDADQHGATYANADGVYLRNAWEKFGFWAPDATVTTADGATTTAKDMADEQGQRPFAMLPGGDGLADFDHLEPAYFRSLDRKMRHLADQGFVPLLETVRRDNCPAWKAYFDFDRSYSRYVEYLIARYGAFNLVFSGIHLDWIPKDYSLTADEFNAALTAHWRTFGGLPFGQPYTTLIDSSTYRRFGHGAAAPWLTLHTVGNKPRNNAIYALIEESFGLRPPYPVANLEPYYTGWRHEINRPGGESPPADSERDNYFARAMMYGSVLSGALAGHVHGTGAYDVTTTGEPRGWRPYIWEALRYASGGQMRHLGRFVLSEADRYRSLELASDDLEPRRAPGSAEDGLDGWSFMMRTPERDLALLYFEVGAVRPRVAGLTPGARYAWQYYDPREGRWHDVLVVTPGADGRVEAPPFPDAGSPAVRDWAAKIVALGPALASDAGVAQRVSAAAPRAAERDPKRLRAGMFLFAVPGMGDPHFAETVVLLLAHSGSGSMGLVVNRPTLVPLRELLGSLPEAQRSELHFHWGGPVDPGAVHALVRTPSPSERARRVLGDVFVTNDVSDLREALARPGARTRVKLFTGYAGWGKGQLELEVRAGAWVLEPADARSIFAPDGSQLWERVYQILERLVA